ncbi:unnamed protein product [Clonostachys byssicola]|uniref:Uncharacterized protein n=1 Tax=Clonostachys byssicola TaxID=160290 RepID=A0A9N9UYB2_9HYPO|nr:unnamed protein product [Clonostachys byssicola]
MNDGRQGNLRPSRLLDADSQARGDADVAVAAPLGQAAILGDLQSNAIRRIVGDDLDDGFIANSQLIEEYRHVSPASESKRFSPRSARGFQNEIKTGRELPQHPESALNSHSSVGIDDEELARFLSRRDSFSVNRRVVAYFERMSRVSLSSECFNLLTRLGWTGDWARIDDWHFHIRAAPEKLAYGKSSGLAKYVPASHIDSCLRVRVADQGRVHGIVDAIDSSRV